MVNWAKELLESELKRILGEDAVVALVDNKIESCKCYIDRGENAAMNIEIHDQLIEYKEELIRRLELPF